jgi:hypothetical protein
MEALVAYLSRPLYYDVPRRRLWIFGQRCHHGATGSLVAAVCCLRVLRRPDRRHSMLAIAAGGALMLHDWKDRSIWFEPGYGSQP